MIDYKAQWYWVRRNSLGQITAALVESAFLIRPETFIDELQEMAAYGPIERIFASRVTIGECLKELLIRK